MNDLITSTSTMTSMQIAEITGKQHQHIMRDIRDEVERLEAGGINGASKFGLSSYMSEQNKELPCYRLTREGVLQLAARYDAVTRAKLIERALESKTTLVAASESEARLLRAKAMEMNAKTRAFKVIMGGIKDKALSPVAEALFGIKALGQITGDHVEFKPEIPAARDLTSIAKDFGVPESCVSVIGKLVKARGIQTEEYTITVLTDVPGKHDKQVPQRLYKPEAIPIIRDVCEGYLNKKRMAE